MTIIRNFTFTVPAGGSITSAGVYDSNGNLVRTLWSGVPYPAGLQPGMWDGNDDFGNPVAGFVTFRVLTHNITYTWEGVIGNLCSAFTGGAVMTGLGVQRGISISGNNIWVSVAYNEGQQCIAQFATSDPNTRIGGMLLDFHLNPSNIATDANNLYWANSADGISNTLRFVAVSKLSDGSNVSLSSGTNTLGYSAIDIIDHAVTPTCSPTGISVSGTLIAVAHGGLGQVKVFTKSSGAAANTISVASMAYIDGTTNNQLAFDPNGNLWVISGTSVIEYTNPGVNSNTGTTITGFSNPLAVATDSSGNVWVADGGTAQQVFKYNSSGALLATVGSAGGYATNPAISSSKFSFYDPSASGTQATGICPDSSGGVWVIDTGNCRILHFTAAAVNDQAMQWWQKLYPIAVCHSNPSRVFLNFVEFAVDYTKSLTAGPVQTAWTMANNWLAGNPSGPGGGLNNGYAGFTAVEKLINGRTYATAMIAGGAIGIYELPASGLLRQCTTFAAPANTFTTSQFAMMENGDLTYVQVANGIQTFYRRTLSGFDGSNNPLWNAATALASVPVSGTAPYFRNPFSGSGPIRFPLSASNYVISYEPDGGDGFNGTTVIASPVVTWTSGFPLALAPVGLAIADNAQAIPAGATALNIDAVNNLITLNKSATVTVSTPESMNLAPAGHHLAGVSANSGTAYAWAASMPGKLGNGAFQTRVIDGSVNFAGGGGAWNYQRHVFFSYHGEGFADLSHGNQVGQANQHMHFYDDGLFIGQFGVENIGFFNPSSQFPNGAKPAGCAGNSFSSTYAFANGKLYWYHGDESVHGGIHRWRIDGINTIAEQNALVGASGIPSPGNILTPNRNVVAPAGVGGDKWGAFGGDINPVGVDKSLAAALSYAETQNNYQPGGQPQFQSLAEQISDGVLDRQTPDTAISAGGNVQG